MRKWTLWAFMGDLCFFAHMIFYGLLHTDILWIIAQIYFMDYCTNIYYAILKTEYQKIIINLYIYMNCPFGGIYTVITIFMISANGHAYGLFILHHVLM